jgi:hypothetical protein
MKQPLKPHFFFNNFEYHHRYLELLKEARIWSGHGQYELAHQCEILAERILKLEHLDESVLMTTIKTEQYWFS